VITLPLILLAILSIFAGGVIGKVVFGNYFGGSIYIAAGHPGLAGLAAEFRGVLPMIVQGFAGLSFWLALAGAATAWFLYIVRPDLPAVLREKLRVPVRILEEKYGFDRFNDWFFVGGARWLGSGLWKGGDVAIIDGFVNGSARTVGWSAFKTKKIQSGRIYHYAFSMIIGVLLLLTLLLLPW
jgi:NADH-quinone oxidoreductase subunit L